MRKIKKTSFCLLRDLILTLFGILVVIGISFVYFSNSVSEQYYKETYQQLNAESAAHVIREAKPFINGKFDEKSLGDIMHSMMVINPAVEVYILNATGQILKYVAPKKIIKLKKVSLGPIKKFIEKDYDNFILGDDPRHPNKQNIFSAAAVKEDGKTIGYVYVVLAGDQYHNVADRLAGSYTLQLGIKILLTIIATALIVGGFIFFLLTKRLNNLIHTVKRFQSGELSARMKVDKEGGVNDLSIAFNEMADTIVGNIENLKSMESMRRELVGNVSHDLRTPLAVIHGYIETMIMKEDRLSPIESKEYLNIALKGTEKLKNLVDELFQLSKLEAKQTKPNKEPFIIEELIHDVCNKLQMIAKKKNIIIESPPMTSNNVVIADIAMIERVLTNLVENAVKYTPQNGKVTLALNTKNSNIQLEVTDNGPGIPEDQLPYIFDRYHIGDKRINLDSNSTGLGLAIVKKILEIHNQTIKIQSQINYGSTFTFQLPLASNLS